MRPAVPSAHRRCRASSARSPARRDSDRCPRPAHRRGRGDTRSCASRRSHVQAPVLVAHAFPALSARAIAPRAPFGAASRLSAAARPARARPSPRSASSIPRAESPAAGSPDPASGPARRRRLATRSSAPRPAGACRGFRRAVPRCARRSRCRVRAADRTAVARSRKALRDTRRDRLLPDRGRRPRARPRRRRGGAAC